MSTTKKETATLGGGCFWCLEAMFRHLHGVEHVISGYAGGHTENPTYEEVCQGDTGHAEVVQIVFDPERISYELLLEMFFHAHDPTTPNRQGNDIGPQYRSIILYASPDQKQVAQRVMADIEARRVWPRPLVTELVPLETFYPAEPYHERYFEKNPYQPYCQFVIAPKVAEFRKRYGQYVKSPS